MLAVTLYLRNALYMENADAFSRLPLPDHPESVSVAPEVIASLQHLSTVPLSPVKLRTLTSRSTVLSKVRYFVRYAWPLSLQNQSVELKPGNMN